MAAALSNSLCDGCPRCRVVSVMVAASLDRFGNGCPVFQGRAMRVCLLRAGLPLAVLALALTQLASGDSFFECPQGECSIR